MDEPDYMKRLDAYKRINETVKSMEDLNVDFLFPVIHNSCFFIRLVRFLLFSGKLEKNGNYTCSFCCYRNHDWMKNFMKLIENSVPEKRVDNWKMEIAYLDCKTIQEWMKKVC